jgi:hypothetical protein
MKATFEIGKVITFWYPQANYSGVRRRMKRRRMLIQHIVRVSERQRPDVAAADPLLMRSEYLICGIDLDTGEFRRFYDGSMEDVEAGYIEPSTIVMEQSFQTGFSVAVVDCQLALPPDILDLPDNVRISDVMVYGVSEEFASMIAKAANRDAMAAGRKDRWAVVFPPSVRYPKVAMALAASSRSASA